MYSKIAAEFIGTFWLVLGGWGRQSLSADGRSSNCGSFGWRPLSAQPFAGFAYRLFLEGDVAQPPISGR
jgi:glycerol uptake facilitator-like aquaporin